MKRRIILACAALAAILLGQPFPAAPAEKADAVYINANIYTVNEKSPKAAAMAVKGGRFLYVGSDASAREYAGPGTPVFDLEGRTVLPGLIDSHLHFGAIGESKMKLDVYWKPRKEILERVAGAYKKARKGEWIEGFGWNQEVWDPPVFPTRKDLDKVAPDLAVYLERTDGHAAWVNSRALDIAGITRDTPNPQGVKSSGTPRGIRRVS